MTVFLDYGSALGLSLFGATETPGYPPYFSLFVDLTHSDLIGMPRARGLWDLNEQFALGQTIRMQNAATKLVNTSGVQRNANCTSFIVLVDLITVWTPRVRKPLRNFDKRTATFRQTGDRLQIEDMTCIERSGNHKR